MADYAVCNVKPLIGLQGQHGQHFWRQCLVHVRFRHASSQVVTAFYCLVCSLSEVTSCLLRWGPGAVTKLLRSTAYPDKAGTTPSLRSGVHGLQLSFQTSYIANGHSGCTRRSDLCCKRLPFSEARAAAVPTTPV